MTPERETKSIVPWRDLPTIAGVLCAAAVVIAMLAAGKSFAIEANPQSTRRPIIVDVALDTPEQLFTMSIAEMRDWVDGVADAMIAAGTDRNDQIVALRLRGASFAYDDLRADQRAAVRAAWEAAGSPSGNVRRGFEETFAEFLRKVARRVSGHGFDAAVLGLPLEGAAEYSGTNDRYAHGLAGFGALVSDQSFIYAGEEISEWSFVRSGLVETLRLREGRPVLYRANSYWRIAFSGTPTEGRVEGDGAVISVKDGGTGQSGGDNSGSGSGSGSGGDNGSGSSSGGDNGSNQYQGEPRDSYPYFWAGSGPLRDEVDLSPFPLDQESLVLLLSHQFGIYPKIPDEERVVHGGVPQRVSLTAHLAELDRDIERFIPDPEFEGFAAMNYEHWKPLWDETKPQYREMSRQLVRDANPTWPAERVERVAKAEYERAAKEYLLATLRHCKLRRPNVKWGYYGFCRPWYESLNWLWDETDAFYPSFYATNYHSENPVGNEALPERWINHIQWQMNFTVPVADGRPIVAFIMFRYGNGCPAPHTGQPLNELDMEIITSVPWQFPITALAVWEACNREDQVEYFNEYYRDVAAPVLAAQQSNLPPE